MSLSLAKTQNYIDKHASVKQTYNISRYYYNRDQDAPLYDKVRKRVASLPDKAHLQLHGKTVQVRHNQPAQARTRPAQPDSLQKGLRQFRVHRVIR